MENFGSSYVGNTKPWSGRGVGAASSNIPALWLDRGIVFSLFCFAIFSPHSIAATQIAWCFGLLLWIARFFVRPRPVLTRTPLDYALLGFFILTFISAVFSYDPDVSIGKLRSATLFTIVYLVAENVRSKTLVRALAITLVASSMINVFFTIGQRIVGRGVEIERLATASPLYVAGIRDGDILLEVDGRRLRTIDELLPALAASGNGGSARVEVARFEWIGTFNVPRDKLLDAQTAAERLGIGSYSTGRGWRATGFYSHFVTYAGTLQLIGALAFGLFISLPRKRSATGALLLVSVIGLITALLLTVTRAFELAFLLSAFVITLAGATRRAVIVMSICAVLVVPLALYLLQQKRNVGFYDQKDQSTTWRETVYSEGLHLLASKPRHLLVGIGMDSIKRHWREWGMFDHGRIPMGHMHSNLLQIALERGLPALAVWLALMVIYGYVLWHVLRTHDLAGQIGRHGWIDRGVVLGALGGLVGFVAAGLVHYNFGDSTVVEIFYFVMGLALVVERETSEALQVTKRVI